MNSLVCQNVFFVFAVISMPIFCNAEPLTREVNLWMGVKGVGNNVPGPQITQSQTRSMAIQNLV
ncbi:MAG: hypothetical protein WCP12_15040 [bacterium]